MKSSNTFSLSRRPIFTSHNNKLILQYDLPVKFVCAPLFIIPLLCRAKPRRRRRLFRGQSIRPRVREEDTDDDDAFF